MFEPCLALDRQPAAEAVMFVFLQGRVVCDHAVSHWEPVHLPGHTHVVRVETGGHTHQRLHSLPFLVHTFFFWRFKDLNCWWGDVKSRFWEDKRQKSHNYSHKFTKSCMFAVETWSNKIHTSFKWITVDLFHVCFLHTNTKCYYLALILSSVTNTKYSMHYSFHYLRFKALKCLCDIWSDLQQFSFAFLHTYLEQLFLLHLIFRLHNFS